MKKHLTLLLLFLLSRNISFSQEITPAQPYPKTTGYASVVHPIVTFDKNGNTFNFSNSYTVGFPFGINILKSDKIGFSFEIAPTIKVESRTDKVSNLLFHPGVMFRFKNGFTFLTRMAFETSGRYGLTTVFNKVLLAKKNVKYFVAVPVPFRFGNDKPTSIGLGLQFGVGF